MTVRDEQIIIGNGGGGGSTADLEALLQDLADNLAVAHDAVDAGNPLKIGGYATDTQRSQVDNGDRVEATFNRFAELIVAGYQYLTNLISVAEADPISRHFQVQEYNLVNVPNGSGAADKTIIIDMDGYTKCSVQVEKTDAGTDTFEWTMESSVEAADSAADWKDTTTFGWTSATVSAGPYTTDGILYSNKNFVPTAHRVVITTAGGSEDSDFSVYVKKVY